MSDMRKVRRLLAGAKELSKNDEVKNLIDQAIFHSFREYVKPRAPNESRNLSLRDVRRILSVHNDDPFRSIQSIADDFDVNPGRVSEIISGKHKLQKGEKSGL